MCLRQTDESLPKNVREVNKECFVFALTLSEEKKRHVVTLSLQKKRRMVIPFIRRKEDEVVVVVATLEIRYDIFFCYNYYYYFY